MNKSSICTSSLLPKMQIKIVMSVIIWLPWGKRRSVPCSFSMFQDFSYWPMAEKWHKGNSLLLGGKGWIPNLLLAAVGKSQCLVDTLQPFMLGKLLGLKDKFFRDIRRGKQVVLWPKDTVCGDTLYNGPNDQLGYVSCRIPNLAASFFPFFQCQFVAIAVHSSYNLFAECPFPDGFNIAVFLYILSLIALFLHFYYWTYTRGKKEKLT